MSTIFEAVIVGRIHVRNLKMENLEGMVFCHTRQSIVSVTTNKETETHNNRL